MSNENNWFIMKYIFIICLFDVLDANIVSIRLSNLDYFNLSQSEISYISWWRKYTVGFFFYAKVNLSGSVLFYLDYLVYSLINCTDDIPS